MIPERERSERGIPRIAILAVAAVAVAATYLLVNIAWKQNGKPETQVKSEGTAVSTGDASSSGGGGAVAAATSTDEKGQDPFLLCTNCHKDLDKIFKEGRVPGLLYRHEMHFSKGVSDCAMCHSAETHTPDKINKPTMARCFMCHGSNEQAMAPGACEKCHPPDFPKKPTTHEAADWLRPTHGDRAKEDKIQCLACHVEETFCKACHGLDTMPHPENWKDKKQHGTSFFETSGGPCQQCHARQLDTPDYCDKCHHKNAPDVPWRPTHKETVKAEGATQCFQCHEPATCARCHVRDEENFDADRAKLEASMASNFLAAPV